MSIKHAKTSAAGPSSDPSKVGGDDWNADHVFDSDGATMTARTDVPASPVAGKMGLFSRNLGGRPLPSVIGPDGMAVSMQPHMGRSRIYEWLPQGSSTTIATIGGSITSAANTSRTASYATNLFASMKRVGFVTPATASSNVSIRGFWSMCGLSSVAKVGGFTLVFRFGVTDYSSDGRAFIGLGALANGAYGAVAPSSMTNIIGIGFDQGDTVWSIYNNDGTGTATKTATTLACNTTATDVMELVLYAPPGSVECNYLVTRLNDGTIWPSTGPAKITTDLPTLALNVHMNITNGTGAGVVGVDLMSMYLETDS